MAEMVLQAKILPEPLLELIPTEKIKVRKINGEVHLIPIKEEAKTCPLLGMYTDGKLTIDKYLEWKLEDKELEI